MLHFNSKNSFVREMEPETSQENGASSKSLMSRSNFSFCRTVSFALLAAFLIFSGCSKNEPASNDNDNTATGTITDSKVTVTGVNGETGSVSKIQLAVTYGDDSQVIAEGDYKNGGFTLNLPSSVNSRYLGSVDEFFEDAKISDRSVKMLIVEELLGVDANGNIVGYFYSIKESSNSSTFMMYAYVTGDVTVTGSEDNYNFSLSLKKGWNTVYVTEYRNGSGEVTTKPVAGMQWYFDGEGGSEIITDVPAPTGVNAVQNGNNVIVTWNKVEGVYYYTIYRSSSANGGYIRIGDKENISELSFTDASPLTGNNYYKVKAFNYSYEESAFSSYALCNFAVTKPGTPTGLTAVQIGATVSVSWSAVPEATSYNIYGSSSINGSYKLKGTSTTASFIDNDPSTGTNCYKVTAVNGSTEGEKSAAVSCTYTPVSGGGTATGLYMGVIGFNEALTIKPVGLLNNYTGTNNKSQFQTFITGLTMLDGTGLYYAVDNAISTLQSVNLPSDLSNVAIVTFTDGLDNVSIVLNTNYETRNAYRDAVNEKLKNTKINGLNINAYSIGIRGSDVSDVAAFKAGITAMASSPENVNEVTSMTEVNKTFKDIAATLYNVSKSQTLSLKITGGYDDGTKIRFTFDDVTDAAQSNFYIEGTYKRSGTSRTLENIVYKGMTSSSGTTVTGEITGVFVKFAFKAVATTAGGEVSTQKVKQWEYIPSMSLWQINSEFGQSGNTETVIDKKSAVIMLVLDCTSSLGTTGFSDMKAAANDFITELTK